MSIGIDNAGDRDYFDEWPKGMSLSRYRFKLEDLLHGKIDTLARSVLCSVMKDTVDKTIVSCNVLPFWMTGNVQSWSPTASNRLIQ